MNYDNYEVSIVKTYSIKLVGWLPSVGFTCPSKIGTVGDMQKLCDTLCVGQCFWKRLSSSERMSFGAGLDVCCSAGEQVKKPHKKHSDAGKTCKCKAPSDAMDKENPRKRKGNNSEVLGAPRSIEVIGDTDDQ